MRIGYPGCEFQIREAVVHEIGAEKADYFFDKVLIHTEPAICGHQIQADLPSAQFLEYFFTDADAAFFKSLGLNCVRLPFNYHHFEVCILAMVYS